MLNAFRPPIPTALLVDFDNVISKTCVEFGDNPLAWLRWLEAGGHEPGGRRRRITLRRVYWNSHNEVYREAFEAAGFEAFACRSEAKSKKSTADMVLAMDALEALSGEEPIQEFILISTDTDFVPLVDRLQDHDRQVVTLVDERDVSSAVYRARADLVITRNALTDAAQTPLEAYRVRRGLWGKVTVGPLPVSNKTTRRLRRARDRNQKSLAQAGEIVARDLMGRGVRRMERERLPRLMARVDGFTVAGADEDRWLGWGAEDAFVDAIAERQEGLISTRSRRGAPQIELSEETYQAVRAGEGPGFDLDGAGEEIARLAAERPGMILNRARIIKSLSGFPTFTSSGARPFMGCSTYRNFIRTIAERRGDLRLAPTPDGGVAVVYSAGGAIETPPDPGPQSGSPPESSAAGGVEAFDEPDPESAHPANDEDGASAEILEAPPRAKDPVKDAKKAAL
ncbi:MAG: NYN domain-containing protein [Maricaulaceae bacterium]|jgi:uncharacterized LabA/DUF88 family protein